MKKICIISILVAMVVLLVVYTVRDKRDVVLSESPEETAIVVEESVSSESLPPVAVVVDTLSIPWDIAFLPEGGFLVTERPGDLLFITPQGERKTIPITDVVHRGEGGLLGIVLHPDFKENRFLYVYKTVNQDSSGTRNAVVRYRFTEERLSDAVTIISAIPGAVYHDGGRMEFGPDGMLYVTTGDATSPPIAQDLDSLGGKILRVRDDGTIPADNPFNTAVYSYGHRNSQGITDHTQNLWRTTYDSVAY